MKNTTSFYVAAHIICVLFSITVVAQTNQPPVVSASGNQLYCPGTALNVVTSFSITDPDPADTTLPSAYVQISSGYINGQDMLTLSVPVPNVTTSWNATAGKLTISGVGGQQLPFATLEQAVKNVTYNTIAGASGSRTFSITVGDANYLPSTGHYYRYISALNISWTAAKAAAEADNYYGLQGYLATLLSREEAQLCGEQAAGTGWIGGSDAETEGVWKWVTGPEAGTVFWNGAANGSTPNFAFWNSGEPNDLNGEDYAHITAPGVGIPGSWNDLTVNGDPSGNYQAKGYIVEYGGMPGESPLDIAASTTVTINTITSVTTPAAVCGSGSVVLEAQSDGAGVYWYDAATGGNLLAAGTQYTTPVVNTTTTYYVSAYDESCTTAPRKAVTVAVTQVPVVTVANSTVNVCGGDNPVLEAAASIGTINWYNSPVATTPVGTGNTFTAPAATGAATYYAEAVNAGCVSATRQAVTLNYFSNPVLQETETAVFYCSGTTTLLDATFPGVTYKWSAGETSASIEVGSEGMYTVEVTNPAGCSAIRTFNVTEMASPVITNVAVATDRATVVMQNNDPENFQYSLDGGPYQNSNIFNNLTSGRHVVVARSQNGCGEYPFAFVVYLIPKYFTPNGDRTNDVFTLAGMSALPRATVTIFDRFGKLITKLDRYNQEWDGTFAGSPLPATDYWYIVKIDDETPGIKGHFSLIR